MLGRAVNAYLKKTMGDEFSAKDFRTWGGTVRAMEALLTADTDSDGLTIDQVHRDAVKAVAKNLGNTPAVAKSAYIDPRLFQRCQALDRVLDLQVAYRRLRDRTYFSRAEQLTLRVLTGALPRVKRSVRSRPRRVPART